MSVFPGPDPAWAIQDDRLWVAYDEPLVLSNEEGQEANTVDDHPSIHRLDEHPAGDQAQDTTASSGRDQRAAGQQALGRTASAARIDSAMESDATRMTSEVSINLDDVRTARTRRPRDAMTRSESAGWDRSYEDNVRPVTMHVPLASIELSKSSLALSSAPVI